MTILYLLYLSINLHLFPPLRSSNTYTWVSQYTFYLVLCTHTSRQSIYGVKIVQTLQISRFCVSDPHLAYNLAFLYNQEGLAPTNTLRSTYFASFYLLTDADNPRGYSLISDDRVCGANGWVLTENFPTNGSTFAKFSLEMGPKMPFRSNLGA